MLTFEAGVLCAASFANIVHLWAPASNASLARLGLLKFGLAVGTVALILDEPEALAGGLDFALVRTVLGHERVIGAYQAQDLQVLTCDHKC